MTIQGAIVELQNLLDADDVPFYYKGGIEKVIETIQMEMADRKTDNSSEKPNNCEEQTAECPFDDNIPCEWVCTEYANCKYKPKDEPQTDCSWK